MVCRPARYGRTIVAVMRPVQVPQPPLCGPYLVAAISTDHATAQLRV